MTYRLIYQAIPKPEGIEKADIPEGFGACDALALVSVIYPPDGSMSTQMGGLDGRTGKALDDDELFKVWTFFAKHLSESKTLSDAKRQVASLFFDMVREAILASRQPAGIRECVNCGRIAKLGLPCPGCGNFEGR